MDLHLGCIADDLTGATDIGLMLATNGMPTRVSLGVPGRLRRSATSAYVIALKIRTAPAAEAVDQALRAADWLLAEGAGQLFYKYCSTFDSTPSGNIGPVTDALLERVHDDFTVLLPAFPENGRTVQGGLLFVNSEPLAESSMRDHPLTPMTESSVVSLMDQQTAPGWTGAIHNDVLGAGVDALRTELAKRQTDGYRYVVVDAGSDNDLHTIARAVSEYPLLTGSSGIARALPEQYRRRQLLPSNAQPQTLPACPGNGAILAGSCSNATREQIAQFRSHAHTIHIDPVKILESAAHVDGLATEAIEAAAAGPVMVYSSADPARLSAVHTARGVTESAVAVENCFARIARALRDTGTRKFLVAGGETSGAVAAALDISELTIGPKISAGVPWMISSDEEPLCVAFKSGNFGQRDFFQRALEMFP